MMVGERPQRVVEVTANGAALAAQQDLHFRCEVKALDDVELAPLRAVVEGAEGIVDRTAARLARLPEGRQKLPRTSRPDRHTRRETTGFKMGACLVTCRHPQPGSFASTIRRSSVSHCTVADSTPRRDAASEKVWSAAVAS